MKQRTTFVQTALLEDEIDWNTPPRRAALPLVRIHCRVCDAKAEQPISTASLLCPLCREDLAKTEAHIRSVLASAELAFINAYDLHQANVAHADEETRRRYQRVQEALGAAHEGAADAGSVKRRYEAARGRDDALGALLREREKAEAIAEEYQRLQKWAEVAINQVEAAKECK
jgi:hypothetical protein